MSFGNLTRARKLLAATTEAIPAPIDQVWQLITDIGEEKKYIAGVVSSSAPGTALGVVRTGQFDQGMVYHETIVVMDSEKHILAYTVAPIEGSPAIDIMGSMELRAVGPTETCMIWSTWVGSIDPEARDALTCDAKAIHTASFPKLRALLQDDSSLDDL